MTKGGSTVDEKKMTTKEKILYILKKDGEISMKELADHFSISDIAIRKHVQALIWDGFIKKRKVRQDIGRPYHVYSLTKKGHGTFPNQYEELPVKMLKDLEAIEGEKVVNKLIEFRRDREQNELDSQLPVDDFDERMMEMIRLQKEKGYMIDYSKLDNGDYHIKIFNCPIFNVASEYHQICENEELMYKQLFPHSNVNVSSYLTKGAKYCSWTFTKSDKKVHVETGT